MNKKLLIIGLAVSLVFLVTACGNDTSGSSSQNKAAMNTIQLYDYSDSESDLMSVVAPDSGNSVVQFAVDDTYKEVFVAYDYYEKGKLVAPKCAGSNMQFSYDAGPSETNGMIYTFIDGDDVVANILAIEYEAPENLQMNFFRTDYLDAEQPDNEGGIFAMISDNQNSNVRYDYLGLVPDGFDETIEIELFSYYSFEQDEENDKASDTERNGQK